MHTVTHIFLCMNMSTLCIHIYILSYLYLYIYSFISIHFFLHIYIYLYTLQGTSSPIYRGIFSPGTPESIFKNVGWVRPAQKMETAIPPNPTPEQKRLILITKTLMQKSLQNVTYNNLIAYYSAMQMNLCSTALSN